MKKTLFTLLTFMFCAAICSQAQRISKDELKSLQVFLNQPAVEASTNAEALKISNINNPASWEGVKIENGNITEIHWSNKKLAGTLNLSGFKNLQKIDISKNKITLPS